MILVRVFVQTVAMALGQIWANKVRSMLTALGIIIGVASVCAVIAALTGLQQYVLAEFQTFGAKKMFIDGNVPRELRGKIDWRTVQMSLEEVEAIIEHAPSVKKITPIRFGSYDVKNGQVLKTNVQVQGIWPEWHEIENRFVIFGRTFTRIDEEECRQVCIINEQAIRELDLDRDPTGDFLIINGRRFLIVGVVETKEQGAMFGGGDTLSEIYIPLSMAAKMNPYGWINYCLAEMTAPDKAEEAKAEVMFIMRKVRKLEPGQPDTFDVGVVQQIIDQFNQMARAMTAIAGGIVGISLLVGGIGIMNIMLVSVSERTREIGLRKAVGAKPSIILMQFLVEAVVLCVVGGLIGLMIGQTLALVLQSIPDSPLKNAEIPAWAIALSFIFSAGVGVVFGMFPAIKAARLDPIEALRHE